MSDQASRITALTPGHRLALERERERRADLRRDLADRLGAAGELLLEAGCGHGHWLADYAAAHPAEVCVGVDLVSDRIRRARRKAGKRDLANLHFFKAEIGEFLDELPAGLRLRRVVFLFPDPWPKKRHHRRRMLQRDLLSVLGERCDPGAELYFRTDDRDYFEWTRDLLAARPDWRIDPEAAWLHEAATFFQDLMPGYRSLVAVRAAC